MIARPKTKPTLRFKDLRSDGTFPLRRLFEGSGITFTYSGRGALYLVCRTVVRRDRDTVLLPAFSCPTVVDPVIEAGFRPRFYSINIDLSIDTSDLLAKLDSDVAAVVVINYFGFPADLSELTLPCRETGAMLIEDCAHSFLYRNPIRLSGERADVAIFSFKKLIPSHVGGGIRLNQRPADIQAPRSRVPLRDTLVNCKQLFEEAVDNLGDGGIRRLYHRLESFRIRITSGPRPTPGVRTDNAPITTFEYPFDASRDSARLPWYARRIIGSANIRYITSERSANYSTLLQGLAPIERFTPVYEILPSTVCPWGFPVLAQDRSSIDRRLQSLGVPIFSFGETLHPAIARYSAGEGDMLEKTRYLSAKLLVVAVRQGLPAEDFSKYCNIINGLLTT